MEDLAHDVIPGHRSGDRAFDGELADFAAALQKGNPRRPRLRYWTRHRPTLARPLGVVAETFVCSPREDSRWAVLLSPAVPAFRPEKHGVALFPANESRKETHCRLSFSDDCNADPGVPHWGGELLELKKSVSCVIFICIRYSFSSSGFPNCLGAILLSFFHLLFQFGICELELTFLYHNRRGEIVMRLRDGSLRQCSVSRSWSGYSVIIKKKKEH